MRRILLWIEAILLLSAPFCLGDKWRVLEHCVLIPNEANDGDSFHVKHKRRSYIFRLYFVDAPETDRRIEQRVTEQSKYWGISENATIQLGHEAAKFSRKFLENGFTVYTQYKDARGSSDKNRFFAQVKVGDRDLAEQLVRHGLARRFGQGTDLSDGTRAKTFWWRLKTAEREAKRNRLGAFAADVKTAVSKEAKSQSRSSQINRVSTRSP